jgi:hypothetical protein
MANKFPKLVSLYFLITGLAALVVGFLLSTHVNYSNQTLDGNFNHQFDRVGMFLGLLLVTSASIFLAYLTWSKTSKLNSKLEKLLSEKSWSSGIFLISTLVLLGGIWVNFESRQLPISFGRFLLIQPVLLWVTFEAVLTIFCLAGLLSIQAQYNSAELLVFVINLFVLHSVQLFLFPLERYWITIAVGLFVYTLLETILVHRGIMLNFFFALDQEIIGVKEALWFIAAPVLLAILTMIAGQGKLIFLLPVFWFVCSLQTFLTSRLARILEWNWISKRSFSLSQGVLWGISFIFVFVFYSLAFDSLKTYPPLNPLLQGDPTTQGVWYTIPVEKSDLFPLGYARLENSAINDQGYLFFAVLGTNLGLVRQCESPFPNLKNVIPVPGIDQPIYSYSFYTLCPEWATTLPEFYWRLGLLSVLLISVSFGVVLLRDPLAFFATTMFLLKAWTFWPPSIRLGQLEGLIFGMAFVILLPYIFGRAKASTIIIGTLFYGMVAGMAGFIRNPIGLALLATGGLAVIVFVGLKKRQLLLAAVTLLALLIGNQMIPTALNGLFWYRDARLQIIAPNTALAKHGGGWNILGGIGGSYVGKILYPNALDMTHWDAIIQLNIYNENPLSIFALTASTEEERTASKLLNRYILLHPLEFLTNAARKTYRALSLMIDIPGNWLSVFYTVITFGGMSFLLRRWLMRLSLLRPEIEIIHEAYDALLLCLVLGIVAAIPAILTDPDYVESTHPAAVVLFITTLVTLYYSIFHHASLGQK